MIGGGVQEIAAAISVKAAGFNLAVSDRNPKSPCKKYADYFLNFDGNDSDGIVKYIQKNKKKFNISGVFTLTELVMTVSIIAEKLNLPFTSLESSKLCQNKSLSKLAWLKDGVSTPIGAIAENQKKATELFNKFRKDIFVKPFVGFGGIGASRISTERDFYDFISNVDLKNYLVEEVCEGKMIDVNGYFDSDENFHPLGCFERQFSNNAIIENLGIYPFQGSNEMIQEAFNLTEAACKSLGICWGPVKSDLVITKDGMKVFEVAPRLHGPKGTLYLTALVHKKNHLEMILPLIIGEQPNISDNLNSKKVAGFCLINPPEKPFSEIGNLDQLNSLGYKSLIFKKQCRSVIQYLSSSDVIGYIFASADSNLELSKKLQRVNGIIDFKNKL